MDPKSKDASKQQIRKLTIATTITIPTNFSKGIQGTTIMRGDLEYTQRRL